MRDASDFSIFGKKTAKEKETERKQPEAAVPSTEQAVPAEPQAKPLASPEAINVEHLTMEQLEALFPSENPEPIANVPALSNTSTAPATVAAVSTPQERRAKRRALISAPVRVRSIDSTRNALDDVTTTVNVSRMGILLASSDPSYYRSMDVMVTFPHSKAPTAIQAEQPGRVLRVSELPDGRRSIAIVLGVKHHQDEEFILSNGTTVTTDSQAPKIRVERDPNSLKPLVLALDAEACIRESLKTYLANEGYDVIVVTNAQEAREVLDQCTPALLIAEIEGEGMPGYDICAHCKSTPRLQSIPVMLTTSSAYPSDYASAHSLGAVVCMAKPYRQERLGHVVKLLAPPPNANENVQPPRPADPSRRHMANGTTSKGPASDVNRRFRFGRKS
jgi:CheY-like chemotaxis protein